LNQARLDGFSAASRLWRDRMKCALKETQAAQRYGRPTTGMLPIAALSITAPSG
jgi:hypothetical protein